MLNFQGKRDEQNTDTDPVQEVQPQETSEEVKANEVSDTESQQQTPKLEVETITIASEPISKPKHPKNVKANIFIISSLIIILFAGAFGYMLLNKEDFPFVVNLYQTAKQSLVKNTTPPEEPVPTEPTEPVVPTPPEEPVIDPEEIVEYISPDYEFSISRKAKTTLVEPGSFDTQLETYQITYGGQLQQDKITNPDNLIDGYLVSITIHKDVINKDINEIALEKRNQYIIKCEDTAVVNGIAERTIANRTAITFFVENCGANYIQSFFIRGNDLFEFNQVYRGDIGIRQVYKAETNEVVDLFAIINTIQPTPINTWASYTTFKDFTFKYPSELDTRCCTLRGPISETAKKVVVMADDKSLKGNQGTLFNGFAIYTDNLKGLTFDTYVTNQKKLLTENYEVIVGKKPVVSEEKLKVGGQDAVMLKGYAWWGNLVIFQYPNNSNLGIFIVTELDPNAFDGVFREILSTVEF